MTVLARTRCGRCAKRGITVIAMWTADGQERVAKFCTPACASHEGWPWLLPPDAPAPERKRRKATSP